MSESLKALVLAVIGAVIIDACVKAYEYRHELEESIVNGERYRYLSGEWEEYHLTRFNDKIVLKHHHEKWTIDWLLRVNGHSENDDQESHTRYSIEGNISGDGRTLHLYYKNIDSNERTTEVYISNLIGTDRPLHGVWVGDDYDQRPDVGPIIYCKHQIKNDEIMKIIQNYDIYFNSDTAKVGSPAASAAETTPPALAPAAPPPLVAQATAPPLPAAAPEAPAKPAAPAAANVRSSSVFPTAIKPQYAGEKPAKARRKTCLDQYKANEATNANGGMKWIKKGGGYWNECNDRLKGG
jgi:hypothetical protein